MTVTNYKPLSETLSFNIPHKHDRIMIVGREEELERETKVDEGRESLIIVLLRLVPRVVTATLLLVLHCTILLRSLG